MTTRVILDCDPGHDDAIALLLALASPEIDLVGVTTVHGNQTLEKTTDNALRVLALVGREDVPVAMGADRPLVRELQVAAHVHGESGLDGPELPPRASEPVEQSAVDFLVEHAGPETVLVPIGPLTNVALALEAGIRPARIVLMGGSIAEGNELKNLVHAGLKFLASQAIQLAEEGEVLARSQFAVKSQLLRSQANQWAK